MQTQHTFTVESATKTHGDSEKELDGVTSSRWTKRGNDRLYINGLFTSTTDVYVNLSEDTVTVSGTKIRGTEVVRDGDGLTVTIKRPSGEIEIQIGTVESTGDETAEDDSEGDSDGDVDLEELGIGL
ncbi:hypothetical protein [Natrinema sp. DC36]|uniref:hypothetical protein n=1 Tax=Natrinema sp. DC36 TaxID=2878680 RepID=UPI001CF03484|nr:hypothetical protein [Natrinema sp. DC36]